MSADLAHAVGAVTGTAPTRVEILRRGGNNVVAKVVLDGSVRLAKLYFAHPRDPRPRLETEYRMLRFLHERRVDCVPAPIACSADHRLALYEFVEGDAVAEVDRSAVDSLADLLARMWELRRDPAARSLPAASDAAFSPGDYIAGVEARAERLLRHGERGIDDFVRREIVPVLNRATRHALGGAAQIAPDARTLSPGDIGFHNALRRRDGSLVFVDFEYAGWDDPAHVIASACQAPIVPVPPELRAPLLDELVRRLGGGDELAERVRLVYPLLAIKWSLILLNEFLPDELARRAFAGREVDDLEQVEKSRRQLEAAARALDGEIGSPG
jgi:hypothetical protein